ncbi:MAG: hypothetical protein NZ518_03245 [Dehalococcoidia bacterium]|nr:hypothetical protein [Dehalococcoidia bacterium]
MFRRAALTLAATIVAAGVVVAGASSVAAHEPRTVGPYRLSVGFTNEPAYTGVQNGLYLRVIEPNNNNEPVLGLETTGNLRAEVTQLGETRVFTDFRRIAATPGAYQAFIIPTSSAPMTVRLTGTINGLPFDETFSTAARAGFDPPVDREHILFPRPAIDAAAVGSPEAAERLNQQIARLTQQAQEAYAEAAAARVMGMAGVGFGIVGVIAAGVAVARGRRGGAAQLTRRTNPLYDE